MNNYDVLQTVLRTADVLAKEGHDWEGDVFDFVSASVGVRDDLSSRSVQLLHKEMCGGSFVTGESEIFFYNSKGQQYIFVKPIEPLEIV